MKFINETGREYYVDEFEGVLTITSYPTNDESEIKWEGEFESTSKARQYLLDKGCSDAAYFNLREPR